MRGVASIHGWLWVTLAVALWCGPGCARAAKVARPSDDVEYVVVKVPGMVPQARLERCTDDGCEEVHDTRVPAGEAP
ncbi:MAG: hypothetical protein ACODAU_09280 [Myxococcota bacterium]